MEPRRYEPLIGKVLTREILEMIMRDKVVAISGRNKFRRRTKNKKSSACTEDDGS